jgi:DNA-binding transcriptional ArsR family regulator
MRMLHAVAAGPCHRCLRVCAVEASGARAQARRKLSVIFSVDIILVFTKIRLVNSVIQALGAPRRQEILRLVWDRERTVGEIQHSLGDLTMGAVSQHLRVLREAGLVASRGEKQQRFYVARRRELGPFRQWLEETWDSALYRLKIRAEMEEARRGPRSRTRRRNND